MKKNSLRKIIVLGITIIVFSYAVKNIIIDRYYSSSDEAYQDSISSNEADFKFDEATGTITKYIGNQTEVVIPSTINGQSVISIGINAFADSSRLIKIIIPDCITSIGTNAFGNCVNLENIIVKHNNKYYTSVDGVLLNKLKTEIIKYPEGKKDTSYNIPKSVSGIGDGSFILSRNLTSIAIPSSVKSIGERAFNGCIGLTNINIPDSVNSIGDNAFGHCNKLISIKISDGVTNISSSEFSDCIGLKSITIPSGVVSIGDSAFYGCSSLESITIPSSVTSIGSGAFWGCDNATFYVESEKTKELILKADSNSDKYIDSNKIVIK